MSKSVIIFRHGKSDWDAAFDSDHNRPVSKRGKKDAKKMGKYLNRIEQDPDLTISSTALRARDTAKLAMEYGKWKEGPGVPFFEKVFDKINSKIILAEDLGEAYKDAKKIK